MRSLIKITNIAKKKIVERIKDNGGKAMLLYLDGGGCVGFKHKFEILNEDKPPSKLDEVIKVDNDYNLYLCGSSLLHLVGTEIDYGETLMGTGFEFKNDNIERTCGCEVSVNFKDPDPVDV